MIKKIGTSIKNISTKILIALIALSFAVWGIGDIFTGSSNPTIATVGKSKIKLKDFNYLIELFHHSMVIYVSIACLVEPLLDFDWHQ